MTDRKENRRGLGRGLSALMADVDLSSKNESAASPVAPRPDRTLPIEDIVPNPEQPRRSFTEEQLEELAESIRSKGVLQPLIVRPRGEKFEIVAGERRWRAAQLAQLHELPVLVRDYSDTEVLEVAIIENIQRADLTAIEEAFGYRQLMDRFGHTQEKMAEALGKSRSHIANLLRLLSLPPDIQMMVNDGRMSAGHARALITSEDPARLAKEVLARGLSVRETEKLAKRGKTPADIKATQSAGRIKPEKDADTRALEGDLSAALGMKVSIQHEGHGQEGGILTIQYLTFDQLDDLCARLAGN